MLDIHPPEHTPHTWRDFFIHMMTIVLGLVIAIGLEQSVEWVHHRHQSRQLEADLRAETQQNIQIIRSDLAVDAVASQWQASLIQAARSVPVKDGFVNLTVPPMPPVPQNFAGSNFATVPSNGVWTVATAEGLVNLLPPEHAKIYNRLEYEATQALTIEAASDLLQTELTGVQREIGSDFAPGSTVRMSVAQRDKYVASASKFLELSVWYDVRLAFWQGAGEAIVDHNVTSMNDMFSYMDRATSAIKEPPISGTTP